MGFAALNPSDKYSNAADQSYDRLSEAELIWPLGE
jgi:hypothetical protein